MEHNIKVGMEYQLNKLVEQKDTAEYYGSGNVAVYATPCMISQMEQAAMLAVQQSLEKGCTSVGTKVNIEHCAATPTGMVVNTKAVLKEIDGRRLVFDVEAWDNKEIIGRGTHERFIIAKDRFMARVNEKCLNC